MYTDDGIVIRVPDADDPPPAGFALLDPDEVEQLVTAELGSSALFASRFRECAARALLLPRRQPGRRSPLWQQRQRAAQLLAVASDYGTFPIVLETMRECLQDVFDVPALVGLMRDLAGRKVRLVEVETATGSPFARALLFRYIGAFMYEGDAPLAERRAQALALDSALLAELLGQADLRDLLDPQIVLDSQRDLQRTSPGRQCSSVEQLADMIMQIGPLSRCGDRRPVLRARRGAWLDRRTGGAAPHHRRQDRGRAALRGDRGRGQAQGRPRRRAADRHPRRLHRAAAGSARRPCRQVRALARAVHGHRRRAPLRPRRRRRHRSAAQAHGQRQDRRGRVPAQPARAAVVRFGGPAPAQTPLPGETPPGSRARAEAGLRRLPAGLAGRAARHGATGGRQLPARRQLQARRRTGFLAAEAQGPGSRT